MNAPPHCHRDAALHRLEKISDRYQADLRLKAIDKLLFSREPFSESALRRFVGKRDYPLQVERGLELYMMMARLTKLCEPKAGAIGPACTVRQIMFEELTLADALELKNGLGLRVVFQLKSPTKASRSLVGPNILTDEEKDLYERIKPYFAGHGKPTLKILAARLLRDSDDRLFSDRAIIRYIEVLEDYEFNEPNYRRDYMIRSVNRFGAHHKSANESARYALAQAITQISEVSREMVQAIPTITQGIHDLHRTLPQVAQTLPLIAQSVAQMPMIIPQLQLAFADLYRSVPQTLSLLANLNLDVRQN